MEFLSLPVVAIENIFAHLSFDEIAKNRRVCKEMDAICQRMLNRGWSSIERRLQSNLKAMKAQLPRRESERRSHPMARHCDILSSIETRISMLNMTYAKFMDNHICCFIPGKIIDEISRILSVIQGNNSPPRAHEVLQELRDISSMAIEHFDDKVSPPMRSKLKHITNSFARSQISETFPVSPTFEQRRCCTHSRWAIKTVKKMELRLDLYRSIIAQQARSMKELESNQAEINRSIAALLASNVSGSLSQDICFSGPQGRQVTADSSDNTDAVNMMERSDMELAGPSVQLKNTRNFGSQIRLDPTEAAIGRKRNSQESNMKPRRASILLPMTSCFDDDAENYITQAKMPRFESSRPSATQNPKTKTNKLYKTGFPHNSGKCVTSNDLGDGIKADMMMRDQRKSSLDLLLSSVLHGRIQNIIDPGQNPLLDLNMGLDEDLDDEIENNDDRMEFGELNENCDVNVEGGSGMNQSTHNLGEHCANVDENVSANDDLNEHNHNLNMNN